MSYEEARAKAMGGKLDASTAPSLPATSKELSGKLDDAEVGAAN
jgi:hypothetical protein